MTAMSVKQLVIVLTWIVFTAAMFVFFTLETLHDFDPEHKLKNVNESKLVQQVSDLTGLPVSELANTVVNFYKEDCACHRVSQSHITALNDKTTNANHTFLNVKVDRGAPIPATPSVMIIGDDTDIIYLGPYGEGLDCAQTDGYASTIYNNHLLGYSANLIITQAQGCYCNT